MPVKIWPVAPLCQYPSLWCNLWLWLTAFTNTSNTCLARRTAAVWCFLMWHRVSQTNEKELRIEQILRAQRPGILNNCCVSLKNKVNEHYQEGTRSYLSVFSCCASLGKRQNNCFNTALHTCRICAVRRNKSFILRFLFYDKGAVWTRFNANELVFFVVTWTLELGSCLIHLMTVS